MQNASLGELYEYLKSIGAEFCTCKHYIERHKTAVELVDSVYKSEERYEINQVILNMRKLYDTYDAKYYFFTINGRWVVLLKIHFYDSHKLDSIASQIGLNGLDIPPRDPLPGV